MHNEFTAIIEKDDDWYIAYCPEIPGANGQGKTIEECKQNLSEAIALILADRRDDALRGVPPEEEWMLPQTGRKLAFSMDESGNWSDRSCSASSRDFQQTG